MNAQRSLRDLYPLWDALGRVPVVGEGPEADTLEAKFLHFEPGTHREAVWRWFEEQNPQFIVGEVLEGRRRQDNGDPSTLHTQEKTLGRDAIQALLARDFDESVSRDHICYYESVEELARVAGGYKCWSYGEVFVHVKDAQHYLILCQIAPASCEMLTISQAGFVDVMTAYRYEEAELVQMLKGALDKEPPATEQDATAPHAAVEMDGP